MGVASEAIKYSLITQSHDQGTASAGGYQHIGLLFGNHHQAIGSNYFLKGLVDTATSILTF